MASEFEYNAPQFRDFNDCFDDSDGADTFFDVENDELPQASGVDENKENSRPNNNVAALQGKKGSNTPQSSNVVQPKSLKKESRQTPQAVQKVEELSVEKTQSFGKPTNSKKRELLKAVRRLSGVQRETVAPKSLPVVDENLSKDLDKLSVSPKKRTHFDGIAIKLQEVKRHAMTTRKDEASKTPTIELRTRVVSKESMQSRKRKSDFGDQSFKGKYIAMAERIFHFQKDTPPRFHSNRRRSSGSQSSLLKARKSYNPRRTIAFTPKLMTKLRSRPVNIPSQHEREEMEVEEMKNQQVKANPLNENIFKPPKLPRKSEIHKTVQEPFNITMVFKKPAPPKTTEEPFKFTAKPVPKGILKKPSGVGPKPEIPVTVPQSPAITKSAKCQKPVRVAAFSNDNTKSSENIISFGVPAAQSLPRKTSVKPFSFESRDKQMLEKKEKKIKEVLEQEKKARVFKANPIPTFLPPKEISRNSKFSHSHLDCSRSSSTSKAEEETNRPFKARSPRVLRKDPFEPVLSHAHSQPIEVQLWTERRAEDRLNFDLKVIEKNEKLALLREQVEMEKKRKEEEELANLRKEIVHKAQPMPKFKQQLPKNPASTIPLTEPKSPRFSKRSRTNTLCSSSASNNEMK